MRVVTLRNTLISLPAVVLLTVFLSCYDGGSETIEDPVSATSQFGAPSEAAERRPASRKPL